MEINEGWSKKPKKKKRVCMSHARVSAHVLNIVLYPAAAEPLPRPNWNVAGVRESGSEGRTDGRRGREVRRGGRREGDRG